MKRFFLFTLIVVIGFTAASTFAAPAQKPAHAASTVTAAAAGTVQSWDAASNLIVVKQGSKDLSFAVTPTTMVMSGKQHLSAADLSGNTGRHVKIKYTVSGSTKNATEIDLAPAATSAKK